MRTLKFKVENQIITKDPKCDFSGLVPGTEGYLQAEFSFSSEWDDCVKVASFRSFMGKEYPPKIIAENVCMIPTEALARRSFKIQIIGQGRDKRLKTNQVIVDQNGGK